MKVLSKRDEKYLQKSLNDTMWKVVLMIGTPLALYQGLQQVFSILDTMMAAHIISEIAAENPQGILWRTWFLRRIFLISVYIICL